MDPPCVLQSIQRLERFQRNFSLASASMKEIEKLKQEFRFLRTYLMYMEISQGKHSDPVFNAFEPAMERIYDYHVPTKMPKHPASTSDISSIEAAFMSANFDLHNSINEIYSCGGRTMSVDPLVTSMLEVIKDFEPQIREAYTFLLKEQSWPYESPVDPPFLQDFTNSVLENLKDLLESKSLIGSIRKSVESLQEKLKFVRNCVHRASMISFRITGALGVYTQVAACLSYLSQVEVMEEIMASEIENKISHLLQKINPSTPELMHMYFKILKASKPTRLDAVRFANFLVDHPEGDEFAAIREGLAFLITFVVNLPDQCTGGEKQISADIQALAREAVSLNVQFHPNEVAESQVKEMNFLLSRLLVNMKLIKAEIFLIELLQPKDPVAVGMEDKFTDLHEGIQFLRTFFVDLEEETIKDSKMFFSQYGKVAHEVTNLVFSIHANKKTEKIILILCVEKIRLLKLLKSEVHLMELQNHKDNWMAAMEDQIQMLRQGLAFLRTFLMDSRDLEDKTEEGKLLLTCLQAVITESSSLISSFFVGELTEEMVNELSLQVSMLVGKIKFLKAEVVLEELLNHEIVTIVQMKVPIKTFKESLRFLRSFLMDPPTEHMEDGKKIMEKSKSVVNEAASLICSVYEEGKAMEIALVLSELLGKITDIKAEIRQMYLHVSKPLQSKHPRTDGLGFVSSLLANLKELLMLNSEADSIAFGKHQIEMLHGDLDFLKSFLIDTVEQHNEHGGIKALWTRVTDVACEAENVIDSFVVRDGPLWYRMLWLSVVIEEINAIKAKVMETYDMTSEIMKSKGNSSSNAQTSNHMTSHSSSPIIDEVVVGFSDEADKIICRLTRGSAQRDIVSIVGMPGIGKSTLAKMVYNNPSVTYHFHIRAWCCISQVYRKRELLLDILGDIVELTDRIHKMDDEDIAGELYRCLKGKRYLIVMDDLWDIGAWEYLRLSFPNDINGSRVLFTSRLHNVVLQVKSDCDPHHLRLLSEDESWELLQEKLFRKEGCPEAFMEVGKVIATKCKGLPLAVVVIAGLLGRTEKKFDWWKQVSQSLNSQIVADPQRQCMHVLELSYKHLPDHLKSCFLYFGAFPEDKEIPVSKLFWLWVAEGFFHTSNSKSLEDSAEESLLDLIARSLVTVAKRGSNGGVKACGIHDLLRVLCVEKAKEENFFELIHGYDELLTTTADGLDCYPTLTYEQRRLCIFSKRKHFTAMKPRGPYVRSLLFFASNDPNRRTSYDLSFICHSFKLIRVLDLESINMGCSFPAELELLVLLRYLAVRGDVKSIPSSVARLWNLETLLVKGSRGEIELPDSFWNMGNLRHVHINDRVSFSSKVNEVENFPLMDNIDTFSTPVLYFGKRTEKMMRRFPRLRKLKCIFFDEWDSSKKCNKFPVLDFLSHLESLKVFYYGKACYPCEFSFPLNIKKLTLSKFCLPWSEIATIGRLPNLEVLKLLFKAFEGKRWDVRDGEFPKLKFLKLDSLDIVQWNASADHFSCLQSLVLQRCKEIEQVPSSLGWIPTLQKIEVWWCNHSAASSVRQILEEQRDFGNEELNVLIHPPEWGCTSSP